MGCTIKDIAKDTKLSLATISKYLNGKNILPENRTLIEESIQKLGYIPNKTAQNLRSKKTNTICILLPVIGDYFWGSICDFMEEYFRRYNYSTIIASYNSSSNDNSAELQLLLSKKVDGVILVPQNIDIINLPLLLKENHIPFVCLDQKSSNIPTDFVTSSNRKSAYHATKYLLSNGHRKLGVIGGDFASYTTHERIAGFRDACDEFHIPKNNLFIYGGEFSPQSSAKCFREMMSLPQRPTALLTLGYNLTFGAIMALNGMDIKIPKDLSLITFDDDEIFSAYNPPITASVQNTNEIAKQTVQLLLKRINGNYDSFPETIMVETQFIERASVRIITSS